MGRAKLPIELIHDSPCKNVHPVRGRSQGFYQVGSKPCSTFFLFDNPRNQNSKYGIFIYLARLKIPKGQKQDFIG